MGRPIRMDWQAPRGTDSHREGHRAAPGRAIRAKLVYSMKNKTKEWLETAGCEAPRNACFRSPSFALAGAHYLPSSPLLPRFFPSFRPPSRTRRRADIVPATSASAFARKRRGAHGVHGRSQRRRPRRFAPLVPPTLPPPTLHSLHTHGRAGTRTSIGIVSPSTRGTRAPTRRRLKRGKIRERPVKHRPRRRHGWFAVERRRAKRHGHHQKRRLVREGGGGEPARDRGDADGEHVRGVAKRHRSDPSPGDVVCRVRHHAVAPRT